MEQLLYIREISNEVDHCSTMTVLLIMPRIIAQLNFEAAATGALRFLENIFSLKRVEFLLSTSANLLNPLSC